MVKKLGLAALFVAVLAVSSFVARAKPPGMRGPGMPRGMLGPGPAAPHRAGLADIFMSAEESARQLIEDGRRTFRFDTFGDEAFWGDQLHLHEAVATLTPRQALDLGLKVDAEALPSSELEALRHGKVDLDDSAVTLRLLASTSIPMRPSAATSCSVGRRTATAAIASRCGPSRAGTTTSPRTSTSRPSRPTARRITPTAR